MKPVLYNEKGGERRIRHTREVFALRHEKTTLPYHRHGSAAAYRQLRQFQ